MHIKVTVWLSLSEEVSNLEAISTEDTCLKEAHSAGRTDWVVGDVSGSSDWLGPARQTHFYLEAQTATCCPGP